MLVFCIPTRPVRMMQFEDRSKARVFLYVCQNLYLALRWAVGQPGGNRDQDSDEKRVMISHVLLPNSDSFCKLISFIGLLSLTFFLASTKTTTSSRRWKRSVFFVARRRAVPATEVLFYKRTVDSIKFIHFCIHLDANFVQGFSWKNFLVQHGLGSSPSP